MTEATPVIYLLAGVTAAGKSKLSVALGERMNGELLSCDSIAIYKGMDVGSAKPSPEDREKVVHHGIDIVDAKENFSVLDYLLYAKGVINDAMKRSTPILVTGGSGFYLQSFLSPVVDQVEVSPDIRMKVEEMNREKGLEGMLQVLLELNPNGLGELDLNNPRRVMRGLERCLASGKTIEELKKEFEAQEVPYADFEKRIIWLDRENEDIEGRIAKRTEHMLNGGLLEETAELLSSGIEKNLSASNSVGYRQCIAHLKGEIPKKELASAINYSTRRLVSKQRKWFRKHFGNEARFVICDQLNLSDITKLSWIRHS